MDKPCKKCEGKGGRQTKPFWITAWITCEPCGGTGVVQKKKKANKSVKFVKYDASANALRGRQLFAPPLMPDSPH